MTEQFNPQQIDFSQLLGRVERLEEIDRNRRHLHERLSCLVTVREAQRYEEIYLRLMDHNRGLEKLSPRQLLGLRVQRWALENPLFLTKVTVFALGVGAAYLAGTEVQETAVALSGIPEKAQRLIETTFAYDPRLIQAGAAIPKIRIIPGTGIVPIPGIELGAPDLSSALEPMFKAQKALYQTARVALNQQIATTVDHATSSIRWGLLGVAGLSSPLTHSWERIVKGPTDFIGRIIAI